MVSPEGDPEYMQKSGTPPSYFFNWHFLKKKRFFNDLRALSQSKVAKFQKLKTFQKYHIESSYFKGHSERNSFLKIEVCTHLEDI